MFPPYEMIPATTMTRSLVGWRTHGLQSPSHSLNLNCHKRSIHFSFIPPAPPHKFKFWCVDEERDCLVAMRASADSGGLRFSEPTCTSQIKTLRIRLPVLKVVVDKSRNMVVSERGTVAVEECRIAAKHRCSMVLCASAYFSSTSLVQPMITTVSAATLQRNPERYHKNLSKLRNAGVVTRVVAPLACNWSIVLATAPHHCNVEATSC
ncbi:hypothetical protein GQ44DRAFT_157868 [Phaeosphaeriaceae sp. PMI808]|nr:hypothetical protein GQ44DRAFT_157868 [Phaeosphaeriaceae sp. PMI808]